MVIQKVYSLTEFEPWADAPENAERRFELIHGEVVEKMPTEKHGVMAARISARLVVFAEDHHLGYVAVEARYRMPGDDQNARLPDISYTRDMNRPLVEQGSVPHMPDLAIEIQSPDDTPEKMREKAEYYLRNGSLLVWLFYTKTETVDVCTLKDGALYIQAIDINGILDGGEVLPGFRLDVRNIFPPTKR